MIRLLSSLVALLVVAAVYAVDEKPAAKPDPAAVRKLVEQLKSDDFETREKATQELSKLEEITERAAEGGPERRPRGASAQRDPPSTPSRSVPMRRPSGR